MISEEWWLFRQIYPIARRTTQTMEGGRYMEARLIFEKKMRKPGGEESVGLLKYWAM